MCASRCGCAAGCHLTIQLVQRFWPMWIFWWKTKSIQQKKYIPSTTVCDLFRFLFVSFNIETFFSFWFIHLLLFCACIFGTSQNSKKILELNLFFFTIIIIVFWSGMHSSAVYNTNCEKKEREETTVPLL